MPGMVGFSLPEPDPYSLAQRAVSPRPVGRGGRALVWATPDDLAHDWEEYLKHMRANPIPVGKRGRTAPAPLSIYGFCTHADVSRSTYYATLKRDDDVGHMLNRIDAAIKDALISGALTRAYDSNITARVTGLADKTESTVNATVTAPNYDLSVLTDEELEQLSTITAKLERSITDVSN